MPRPVNRPRTSLTGILPAFEFICGRIFEVINRRQLQPVVIWILASLALGESQQRGENPVNFLKYLLMAQAFNHMELNPGPF